MAIDLNELPLEAGDVPQPDFNNYADPSEFAPPIVEGTYNFKTTNAQIEKFEKGIVSFILDHEGYNLETGEKSGDLKFDRISTKVFDRNGVPVSMAADQLRACGVTERPNSPREWGEAILATKAWCDQGNFWQGVVQWDGYCNHKDTQFETQVDQFKKPLATQTAPHAMPFAPRGMKKWPSSQVDGVAHYDHVMPCPTCEKDVAARARVNRRIPKS